MFSILLLGCNSAYAYVLKCTTGDYPYLFVDEPSFNKQPFRMQYNNPPGGYEDLTAKRYRELRGSYPYRHVYFFKPKKELSPTLYGYEAIPEQGSGILFSDLFVNRATLVASTQRFVAELSHDPKYEFIPCEVLSIDDVKKYISEVKAARDAKAQAERDKAKQNKF
jgi:hypothetical protein